MKGASAELSLKAGATIKITTDDAYMEQCDENILYVDYKNITQVMKVGSRMFIDDGLISVVVKEMGQFNYYFYPTLIFPYSLTVKIAFIFVTFS